MQDQSVLLHMEEALRSEYQAYMHLLTLSELQYSLLDEPEPDVVRIASIMDQKMQILDQVRELDSEHKPIKEKWETLFSVFPMHEKQNIAILKEKLVAILENLRNLEDQVALSIRKCEDAINLQLKAIYRGRVVNQAYFKINERSSRYFDKKK